MKIGLLIPQLRIGGGPYQLLRLAQELHKKGHTIYVYTIYDEIVGVDKALLTGLIIKSCGFKRDTKVYSQLTGFIRYFVSLIKSSILLAGIMEKDDLDITNPHEWPMQWAAALLKIKKGVPIVWMCNDVWHIPGEEEPRENRVIFRIGQRTIIALLDIIFTSFVDRIAVLSYQAQKEVYKFYRKKSVVVRSGIDIEKFQHVVSQKDARKKLSIPSDTFVFLCFQFFLPHRRFEDAINAFKLVKEKNKNKKMQLYIVGSDKFDKTYTEYLKKLVKENDLEKDIIIKTEYVSDKELPLYFSACDAFLFPNEKYMWGLIVVEVMATGKACVISSGAGVSEIIEEDKNGLLFEVTNVDSLAEKMEKLLKDPSLKKQLGQEARKYVFKHLSWEKYGADMFHIFKEVSHK